MYGVKCSALFVCSKLLCDAPIPKIKSEYPIQPPRIEKKNNRPIPKSDNLRQNEKVFFKPHNKYGTDPILTKALACDSAHVRYYILF